MFWFLSSVAVFFAFLVFVRLLRESPFKTWKRLVVLFGLFLESLEVEFGLVGVGLEFHYPIPILVFEFACRRISFLSESPDWDLNRLLWYLEI